MGVLLKASLDTNLGSSDKVYIRIENINLNRTFGKVRVAVTYWIDQKYSNRFKHSNSRNPKGQIQNKVVYYTDEHPEGVEVDLPVVFESDLTKPKEVVIPIYEVEEVADEVPYIKFDELGRRQTGFRTVVRKVKNKVGEKKDVTQVLDFDIEKTLISWCYGQIKAELASLLPVEFLQDC